MNHFLWSLYDVSGSQSMDFIAPPGCVECPRITTPFVVYDAMFWINGHHHNSNHSRQITVPIGDIENSCVLWLLSDLPLVWDSPYSVIFWQPLAFCALCSNCSPVFPLFSRFSVSNMCNLMDQNGSKKP